MVCINTLCFNYLRQISKFHSSSGMNIYCWLHCSQLTLANIYSGCILCRQFDIIRCNTTRCFLSNPLKTDWLSAKLLMILVSRVILGFESRGTDAHILLSDGPGSLQNLVLKNECLLIICIISVPTSQETYYISFLYVLYPVVCHVHWESSRPSAQQFLIKIYKYRSFTLKS
jgi:hypothetical protein